jgi:hypothetical protein
MNGLAADDLHEQGCLRRPVGAGLLAKAAVTGCVTGRSRSPASRLLQIMRTSDVYQLSQMVVGLRFNPPSTRHQRRKLYSRSTLETRVVHCRYQVARPRSRIPRCSGGRWLACARELPAANDLHERACLRRPVGAELPAKAAGQSREASQGDRVHQQAGFYRFDAPLTPVRRKIEAASRACSAAAPLSTKLPRRHAVGFAEAT